MATTKPRVTVTLEPQVYAVVRELSDVNGESMSKIIADLVGAVTPTLEGVIEAGRKFEQLSASVQQRIRGEFEDAEASLLPQVDALTNELLGRLGSLDEALDAAAATDQDPRPVTRGSRPPASPPSRGGEA